MNKHPVYIVDDDQDDDFITKEAFEELNIKNELIFFRSGYDVLTRLRQTDEIPFLIISDVNLPKMDGFMLREKILNENNINHKSVPFIFWSTNASEAQIKKAYELSAHGFFLKGRDYTDLKTKIKEIVDYWSDSLAPRRE